MIIKDIYKVLILGFEIFTSIYFTTAIPVIWIDGTNIVGKIIKTILCLFIVGANAVFITDDIKGYKKGRCKMKTLG